MPCFAFDGSDRGCLAGGKNLFIGYASQLQDAEGRAQVIVLFLFLLALALLFFVFFVLCISAECEARVCCLL